LIYEILRCENTFKSIDQLCFDISKLSPQFYARIKAFSEGPIQKVILHFLPHIEQCLKHKSSLNMQDVKNIIHQHHESLNLTYVYPWAAQMKLVYVEAPKETIFFESYLHQCLLQFREWNT
jgi:hypothetical protein